ncbi:di-heme oxidoredictase family protein [Microvirga antarctica]|uniref:di-heme oxidoredictase family protein n=1 Tax=Microvirga antarctica TaxID=2819233 RepID=UPI001B303FD2|nr:di-heme oxidoredictase family protein [Microvirga antarctica]
MTVRCSLFRIAWLAAALTPLPAHALDDAIGRALFRRAWVPAPSSTLSNDGLGPLFNARSCAACHEGLDRKPVAATGGVVVGEHLVLRLSDRDGHPDPVYGRQLQTGSVAGVDPEGTVTFRDGRYQASALAYGDMAGETRVGARVAPALRGLGALESVPDEAILAGANNRARTADGVTGRVNWVTDLNGHRRVGRFGWKASAASISDQVETAFLLDLGLSTKGHPRESGDCTAGQAACLGAPHGGDASAPEMSEAIVARISTYLAGIAPPVTPDADPRGLHLFEATGCAGCHRPSLPGARGPVPAFTDLLLHDLGPRTDGGATDPGVAPSEWRTAPLWGLSRIVEAGAGFLHDGRAATIEEAIAFHGGEADRAALGFRSLPERDRQRLLIFLRAL